MADPNLANGDTITAIQLLTKGLNDLEATLKDEPEIRASLLHEFTSIFIGLGRYQLADSLAREAYTLTDSIYSSPHPEVARSLLGLGQVEIMYKNLDTAFNHLHASYKMYKDIKSNDPSAIANVLLELGNVNYEKGDYLAADSLNRKVFEIHQTHYQSPHEELAHDLQMIGTTQRKLGNFNEAVSYLQQALAMKRELFEEPHNEIAYTLNHLASLKVDLGLYEEAVPYARESFDQRSRIYGPIHLETIASQSNLARIHKALGHYETAIPIYEDALKKLKKIFPSGHPYIGATLQSLADLYLLSENISLAEEYFREALLIDQKFLDKDDIHRSYCMIGLGKLLTRINRLEEAKYLLESAYELRTINLPEGHVLIGINQQALGECLLAMKDYETTIYYLNEAYESLIKMPDKYQDNLQIILEKLIFACEQSGFTERQSKYRLFLNNLTS